MKAFTIGAALLLTGIASAHAAPPAPKTTGAPTTAAATAPKSAAPAHGPVSLQPRPNTDIDATARTLVAADLARAAQSGEAPLLLVGEAPLGGPKDRPALFIQLQSARECGSAGCSTSVYLLQKATWRLVLDSVAGPIAVDTARHGGMHDLLSDRTHRWIWNGTAYADTKPAANIDLRPKKK